MTKFKAYCKEFDKTFYIDSLYDLKVALVVKYIDRKGVERFDIGWSTSSHDRCVSTLLTKLNVGSMEDERIIATIPCNVEKIS